MPDVWGKYGWIDKSALSSFIDTIDSRVLRILLRALQRLFGSRDLVGYYTFISSKAPANFTDEVYGYDEEGRYSYDQTKTGQYKVNYDSHSTSIDISPDHNPGIQSLLNKYAEMYKENPEELKKNHIFYDINPATSYYPLAIDNSTRFPGFITDWNNKNYYNVVVVNNNIQINDYNGTPSDDEYAIIISLNGDITYTGKHPFNGILYAPNGMVLIKGDGYTKFTGSIVARYVLVTAPNQEIHWKNYFQNNSDITGSGDKKVKLIQ